MTFCYIKKSESKPLWDVTFLFGRDFFTINNLTTYGSAIGNIGCDENN